MEEKVKKCEKSDKSHFFPLLGDLRQGGRKPKSTFALRGETERRKRTFRVLPFLDHRNLTFPSEKVMISKSGLFAKNIFCEILKKVHFWIS